MKKEQLNKLLELYKEGKTSRDEEKTLKEYYRKDLDKNAWFNYISDNSKTIPEELEQSLNQSLEKRQQSARTIRRTLISAAAIALLLVSTFVFKPWQRNAQMSKAQIIATLNEVNELFIEEPEEIIYEDEALVIYLK